MPIPLLFLIADTGGGHRASATAVAQHLEEAHPGEFDVRIVDPFAECSPRPIGRTAGLYGPIIQHAPWLWGGLYHATNSRVAVAAIRSTVLRGVITGIGRLLAALEPALIVSFHPLLNHVTVRAVARGSRRIAVMTVITDLVDVHASWACRDVDLVVTPSPGGVDRCRRAGIPADRVVQIGLPVNPSFAKPPPTDAERRLLRARLGLDPDRFTVLICSGADGSGGIDRRSRAIAGADQLDVQIVAICGHNDRVRRRLEGLVDSHGRPVQVHGFVTDMADWMRAADIVVTKAGPGTIAEALCCGLPLLLTWYLPGQERGNVTWVVDVGAGRYVPGVTELVDTVAELATPGSTALASMREVVARMARPDATPRIGELIRALAQGGAGAPVTA
jgi:1,2-diacylglycerol 3-beta-galactosyltransferase